MDFDNPKVYGDTSFSEGLVSSHFASIVQIYGKLMEIFVFVESTVGREPHGIHVHEEKIWVMNTDEVVQVFLEKHQHFVVSY